MLTGVLTRSDGLVEEMRTIGILLILAFLFCIGSVGGWLLELGFRHFVSGANPEHKWINPGFCTGPYLPIYGCGLVLLYLIASLESLELITDPFWNKVALFAAMAVCMTAVEYIAGVFCLRVLNVRLWDYSDAWGNLQGIICPEFSFFWAVLGAVYYFLIHPRILDALYWLANNLAFSFFIGLFFGVFIMDVARSAQLVSKLKQYAQENDVVVRYEEIKAHIRRRNQQAKQKYRFFSPFRSELPLTEHLKELYESMESHRKKQP